MAKMKKKTTTKKCKVSGTIVGNSDKWIYDWFGIEATCPKDIEVALNEAAGEEIIIEINSGGGDVFAGNEMSYLISQYAGNTIADISGFCGSAATIIACSANTARMNATAMYMIHNVSSEANGDYREMDKQSNVLQTANKAVSNAYRLKTGMSQQDLLKLMDETTWLDAQGALEKGFIDEIIGNEEGTLSNVSTFALYNGYSMILPDEVKEKIRNSVKNPDLTNGENQDFLIAKEKLKIMRMRGEM